MNLEDSRDYAALENLPSPEVVTGVTQSNFQELVVDKYRPVVMRGLANHWPLVEAGKISARRAARHITRFEAGKSKGLLITPPEACGRLFYNDSLDGMNFAQRSATLSQGIKLMLEQPERKQAPRYFFQCVGVKDFVPGLETEVQNPLLDNRGVPYIWIGNRITVAPHFDDASNIAVVAVGRRRFTFFPPEQVENLYVGPIDYTPAGQPISLVDLRNPDLTRFPKYRTAYRHALSVLLDPGDAVFIPSPWWHHVESQADFNVLVNFWWSGVYAPGAMPFPALIHAMIALKHLPLEQRAAWKKIVDHYVFEENGDPGEHLSPSAKGMLGELTPQLINQLHQWLVQRLR